MPNTFGQIQKYGTVLAGEFAGEPAVEDADPQDIVDQLLDAGDVNLLTDLEYTFFLGIYSLTPVNDDILQLKGGAWVNRTVTQYKIDLALNLVNNTADLDKPISNLTQSALDLKQDLDTELTQFAGLAPVQGDILFRNGSSWALLAPGTAGHSLKTQGAGANPIWTAGGMGDAFVANPLSQFGATTSAQLAGVLSDETGYSAGALAVFNISPVLVTPNLGTPSALVGTNISGTGASFTAGLVSDIGNLTGHITSSNRATTIGAGVVTEAMQVLADNTTNNASTTAHGYLKKLSNVATEFINGVGDWATPEGLGINDVLTGFVSGAGTVADTDTILEAIQKLDGNIIANDADVVHTTGDESVDGIKSFVKILKVEIPAGGSAEAGLQVRSTVANAGNLIVSPMQGSLYGLVNGDVLVRSDAGNLQLGTDFSGGEVRLRSNTLASPKGVDLKSDGSLDLLQGQLKFPATANPSADANTLDDYEEGTWTPGIKGETTAGSYTYEAVRTGGRYQKIGNTVKVWGVVRVSTTSVAGTGAFCITGLPFAIGANIATSWGNSCDFFVKSYGGTAKPSAVTYPPPLSGVMSAGETYVTIVCYGTNEQLATVIGDFDNNDGIYEFEGSYSI